MRKQWTTWTSVVLLTATAGGFAQTASQSPAPGAIAAKTTSPATVQDWANLPRYFAENAALLPAAPGENRVVFMGDSITDGWGRWKGTGDFFPGRPYVNRGISGQTTPQMLVRFNQDVVSLHPAAVVILAGTNDIAGNTGPSTPEQIEANLAAMAVIAKANGIAVVLASITPAFRYPWKPEIQSVGPILAVNTWMRHYCEENRYTYLDYYSSMADEKGGMLPGLSADGVHPKAAGYAIMGPLAEAAISNALATQRRTLPLAASSDGGATRSSFNEWPVGTSPREVGKLLADHFVESPHQYGATIHYSEVAAWYGALTFSQLTGDSQLRAQLIRKFEPLMPGGAEASRIPTRRHVDDEIFGIVPLEIGLQTKDAKYLAEGLRRADRQWENPQPDGLSAETRYWIDDMYMLTILQAEAYRATGDRKYLDRDAEEMVAYLAKLQQPDGLFFHAPDVPYYWGRGDGWVAAGMAEILRDLPVDHPRRPVILAAYRKMMAALLRTQGEDGMWRQLVDQPDAWPESSSSAMFTFAMITGVKNGWLDESVYAAAARRGWLAVVGYVDQNGNVTSVCEGTGKKNDRQYYLDRKRNTGDFHGQAAVLWAASALLR